MCLTSVQTQKSVALVLLCPKNSFVSKYLLVHLFWRDPRCRETSASPHSANWRRPSYIPPCRCWVDSVKPFTTEFGWARADRGSCSSSSWQTDEVVFGNLKAQNKTTMTSTNMFQGLDTGTKPSSRVLQPPGGGSSNLFGGYEEDSAASRRPHKMASNVFAAPAEPQSVPRRSNPPGGKSSGIFGDPEPPAQPQRPMPPGGPSSNIFGAAEDAPVQSRSHPNKPKDNLSVGPGPESPAPEAKVTQPEVKEEAAPPPAPVPAKEEPAAVSAPPEPEPSSSSSSPPVERDMTSELKKHEPHLGPKPRSHNRVLNPPGGKSSVVFY